MVSLEQQLLQPTPDFLDELDQDSSPRISFSSEFLDENNFISICPNPQRDRDEIEGAKAARHADHHFEFLSSNPSDMITADELISEGKLLPFWQMQYHSEKLKQITLKSGIEHEPDDEIMTQKNKLDESRINWFIDDDPSPRPPKCTVLWKELLRLKKQSTLSPSASSSSSSSKASSADTAPVDERKEARKDKSAKRIKKGNYNNERTRSGSIRIRPVLNVPICTQAKNMASLPTIFSLRKARLER